MAGIRIKSNNFNGESVEITFNPFSGGTINLGTQTIPYDYVSSNYEGNYSIYIPSADKTCPLQVGVAPTPTPSITPTNTQTPTPTITPTSTITPTPTITPTSSLTPTPTPSASVPAGDPDANAYLADVVASGGTTNPTIEAAVQTLFTDLKSAGLYSKMIAMYPYVGATASSHSINATLDKTYDITWYGGMTHGISGSTGDGINGYGDTNFSSNVYTNNQQSTFGIYVVNGDTSDGVHGGFFGAGFQRIQIGTNYISQYAYGHGGGGFTTQANSGNIDGSFISVRTGNTEAQLYRNTTNIITYTSGAGSTITNPVLLFNMWAGTIPGNFYTNDTLAFSFFANNITYSEVSTLDSIINTFQTSLGRNTY